MAHGDPGVGKSDLMLQLSDRMYAEAYGCQVLSNYTVQFMGTPTDVKGTKLEGKKKGHFVGVTERPWFKDFRTALHDAVDLTGVPYVKNEETLWARPGFLPKDPRGGIWLFDEVNRGPQMTQNACLSIALNGTLNEYEKPKKWVVAAAVNDKDTGVSKMSAALTRRFTHVDIAANLEDSCKYAVRCDWQPVVIAFLRMRPQLLNVFDPKERVGPNPRAWQFVSNIVGRNIANRRVQQALFAGKISDSTAVEFAAFLDMYKKLPSIDSILLNPKHAEVPNEPPVLYAISAALSRRAKQENLQQIITYTDRCPSEFSVFSMKDAIMRDATLQNTPEFTRWAVAHQDVVL
jgi:hypothetical protein